MSELQDINLEMPKKFKLWDINSKLHEKSLNCEIKKNKKKSEFQEQMSKFSDLIFFF